MTRRSLLRSVADIWAASQELCALIPFDRVFTGRVPQTEIYRFPYVSVLATQGSRLRRTDKARYSAGPISFHIWVDESSLEFALAVSEVIADV